MKRFVPYLLLLFTCFWLCASCCESQPLTPPNCFVYQTGENVCFSNETQKVTWFLYAPEYSTPAISILDIKEKSKRHLKKSDTRVMCVTKNCECTNGGGSKFWCAQITISNEIDEVSSFSETLQRIRNDIMFFNVKVVDCRYAQCGTTKKDLFHPRKTDPLYAQYILGDVDDDTMLVVSPETEPKRYVLTNFYSQQTPFWGVLFKESRCKDKPAQVLMESVSDNGVLRSAYCCDLKVGARVTVTALYFNDESFKEELAELSRILQHYKLERDVVFFQADETFHVINSLIR